VGGRMLEKHNIDWLRIFYVPTFLFNSNWTALEGLYRFAVGKQTNYWVNSALA